MFKMHNIVYFITIDLHSITLKDKRHISVQNNQCISTKYQEKLLNRSRNMAQKTNKKLQQRH